MESRAAQFSPFAALTGYGDEVSEMARLTGKRIELDRDEVEQIDAVLQSLCRGDSVEVEYFEPDARKAGGSYRQICGVVKTIDPMTGVLVFEDRMSIAFADILHIAKMLQYRE